MPTNAPPMHKLVTTLTLAVVATACGPAIASDVSPAAQATRPARHKPMTGDPKLGEALFNDTTLSTNGMACASCHANYGAFQANFAKPYPHAVSMAKEQMGMKRVHLDEMIQACMLMPMAAKPLPWESKELAGLVAYVQSLQKTFKPSH